MTGVQTCALPICYHVFKVRQAKSALFFRVEKSRTDLNFEQFRQQVRKVVPAVDLSTMSATLREADGTATRVEFDIQRGTTSPTAFSAAPKVYRNGQLMQRENQEVFSSPNVTLAGARLSLGARSKALSIDRSSKSRRTEGAAAGAGRPAQ